VARQVVHDHDVAAAQLGTETLGDGGLERSAVDRAVEDKGRDQGGGAEPSHEGAGLPVSVGDANPQTLVPWSASVPPRHGGRSPGLVDDDKAGRVEVELAFEPSLAPPYNVRPVLL
jgi:hypothetical protein